MFGNKSDFRFFVFDSRGKRLLIGTGVWSLTSFLHQVILLLLNLLKWAELIMWTATICTRGPGLGVSEIGIGKHSKAGREGGDLAKPIIECLLEVRKPAVVIHAALLWSVNAR